MKMYKSRKPINKSRYTNEKEKIKLYHVEKLSNHKDQ